MLTQTCILAVWLKHRCFQFELITQSVSITAEEKKSLFISIMMDITGSGTAASADDSVGPMTYALRHRSHSIGTHRNLDPNAFQFVGRMGPIASLVQGYSPVHHALTMPNNSARDSTYQPGSARDPLTHLTHLTHSLAYLTHSPH